MNPFARWPWSRKKNRVGKTLGRRMYAGARMSNLEYDWLAHTKSANTEILESLRKLRDRSRQMSRDNAHMASFVHLLRTNVVGPNGIRLQARIEPDGAEFNRSIEVGWKGWGKKGVCTADGQMTFAEAQAMAIELEAVDGEYFIHHRAGFDNRFRYAIQFIDPDLLDEKFNQDPAVAGPGRRAQPRIVMGVELDRDGRPVAYHFKTDHDSTVGGVSTTTRIHADQIEHGFIQHRPGQTRGVPWAAPVMLAMSMFEGYSEAELVAARTGAAKAVFYTQDPETVDGNTDYDAELVDEIVPGMAGLLPPGITPHQMDPQHPNGAYDSFSKSILRSITSGLGSSYSAMTGDLRDVNFSSIRTGLLQERDAWQCLQRHHVSHFCDPVFRRWARMSVLADAIEVPGPETDLWADQVVWQPRGWAWVDPMKDVQAAEAGIALGTTTRSAVAAGLGVDYEDNLETLARERELAAEAGVDVSGLKAQGGVNGGQGQDTGNDVPDGDGGSDAGGRGHPSDYPDSVFVGDTG